MDETDVDIRILLCQVMRHMLRTIHRAMLTSCAAKADHQACEPSLSVCFHMRINDTVGMLKESEYLTIILQEPYHRLVSSGQFLIRLISSRVMD